MIVTDIALADVYVCLEPQYGKAFNWLRSTDLDALTPGESVAIDGAKVFARVLEYETRPAKDCRFETHDKFTDIQYIVSGKEQIGYAARKKLMAEGGYDAERDISFYTDPAEYGTVVLEPGYLGIFTPADGHKPSCAVAEPARVKKIVIKVSV